MCFNAGKYLITVCTAVFFCSCGNVRVFGSSDPAASMVGLNVADDMTEFYRKEYRECSHTDTLSRKETDGPLIMNAIRDTETGEMVATDVISAAIVSSRFLNVAERNGKVTLQFDITVPGGLLNSDLQVRFFPEMIVQEDTLALESLYITGDRYRHRQLRGYERYEAFLNSIITDSTVFIRKEMLEIFLKRHFPETYSMKTDSSFISDPVAENYFGVSQRTALEHYTRKAKKRKNEWKKSNKDLMFSKFVKSPIVEENIRLDTVINSESGEMLYRYAQALLSRPGLKKVIVGLSGAVFRDGEKVFDIPRPDSLTYYVSSLSSLVDSSPRYISRIVERVAVDSTNVFLDFEKGSARLDTLKPGNAAELKRLRRCFSDISSKDDFVVDSVILTTSCSLEGSYAYNEKLASRRTRTIVDYIESRFFKDVRYPLKSVEVAENWEYFETLVNNDAEIGLKAREKILRYAAMDDRDYAENCLQAMPEYAYLRRSIYPRLRTVRFDFHLHRKNMLRDTVHTSVLDTAYMNGVAALQSLDYQGAVRRLRPYGDYNSALALASAGYDATALGVLGELKREDAKSEYLKALILSRLKRPEEAVECFRRAVDSDSFMLHRANLDPEMSELLKIYHGE